MNNCCCGEGYIKEVEMSEFGHIKNEVRPTQYERGYEEGEMDAWDSAVEATKIACVEALNPYVDAEGHVNGRLVQLRIAIMQAEVK